MPHKVKSGPYAGSASGEAPTFGSTKLEDSFTLHGVLPSQAPSAKDVLPEQDNARILSCIISASQKHQSHEAQTLRPSARTKDAVIGP